MGLEHEQSQTAAELERVEGQSQSQQGRLHDIASAIGNQAFATGIIGQRRVQRSAGSADETAGILPDGTAHPDVEAQIAASQGAGTPLDGGTRERIGDGLGDSLDDVRVHADPVAASLARAVSARAFAVGTDIFFGQDEYRPGTTSGDELIAHEAAHTIQQRGASTSGPLPVSDPDDALEINADRAAGQALTRSSRNVSRAPVRRFAQRYALWRQQQDEEQATAGEGAADSAAAGPQGPDAGQAESAEAMPQPKGGDSGGGAAGGPAPKQGARPTPPGQEQGADATVAGQQVSDQAAAASQGANAAVKSELDAEAAKLFAAAARKGIDPAQLRTMDEASVEAILSDEATEESTGAASGAVARRSLQRAPRRKTEGLDAAGWENLYVGMEVPDPIVLSRYNGAWAPKGYFNQSGGWHTNPDTPAHLYLNGQLHAGWDAEDDWHALPPVQKARLQEPGADAYAPSNNPERATFKSRPMFQGFKTVEVSDSFQTWRTHLRAKPTASMTEDAFDETNVIPVLEQAGGAATRPAQAISVNISQAVATTVSQAATGTFGHTTSRSRETSAEAGAEGGKKDVWNVSAKVGHKFGATEQEQAQRALSDSYSEVSTASQSYTVTYNVPAGVPCAVLIVPVTRKVTSNFQVLNSNEQGFVEGNATETAVSESHVPKGHAAVFGYDVEYVTALQRHYEDCRALRQSAGRKRGAALEEIKSELRRKITEFSTNHQPSATRARENAMAQLRAMSPTPGAQQAAPPAAADNISRWHTALEEIWRFAAGTTPPPGGGPR